MQIASTVRLRELIECFLVWDWESNLLSACTHSDVSLRSKFDRLICWRFSFRVLGYFSGASDFFGLSHTLLSQFSSCRPLLCRLLIPQISLSLLSVLYTTCWLIPLDFSIWKISFPFLPTSHSAQIAIHFSSFVRIIISRLNQQVITIGKRTTNTPTVLVQPAHKNSQFLSGSDKTYGETRYI